MKILIIGGIGLISTPITHFEILEDIEYVCQNTSYSPSAS